MKIIHIGAHDVLIDDDDYENYGSLKWSVDVHGYVVRQLRINRKRKNFYLHRLVNQTPRGEITDHIDRNKLNNQKSNLRTATNSENSQNRNAYSKTGYHGVYQADGTLNKYNRFVAFITICGKKKYLGSFKTPELAALAYNAESLANPQGHRKVNVFA